MVDVGVFLCFVFFIFILLALFLYINVTSSSKPPARKPCECPAQNSKAANVVLKKSEAEIKYDRAIERRNELLNKYEKLTSFYFEIDEYESWLKERNIEYLRTKLLGDAYYYQCSYVFPENYEDNWLEPVILVKKGMNAIINKAREIEYEKQKKLKELELENEALKYVR